MSFFKRLATIALVVCVLPGVANADLVAHWTFDTDASDSSGNGIHGTLINNAQAGVADPLGQRSTGVLALNLFGDGDEDYVETPFNALLDFPSTWSMAAWVKLDSFSTGSAANHIVRRIPEQGPDLGGSASEAWHMRYDGRDGREMLFSRVRDDEQNILMVHDELWPPDVDPLDGFADFDPYADWHFVAVTYDGPSGLSHMYIDDMENPYSEDGVDDVAPAASSNGLRIGRGVPGGHYNGYIDDVWLFNHALSTAELTEVKSGSFTPPQGTPGDYNGDGTVDAADYVVWRDNDGGDASVFAAGSRDGSNSGVVNAADYSFWAANYGATGASSAAAVQAPEPGALALMAAISSVGFLRRSRSA